MSINRSFISWNKNKVGDDMFYLRATGENRFWFLMLYGSLENTHTSKLDY